MLGYIRMDALFVPILTLAVTGGQLIRIPFGSGNITPIDAGLIATSVLLLFKFKPYNPPLFIKFFLIFLATGLISLILSPLNLSPEEFLNSLLYLIRLSLFAIFLVMLFSDQAKLFRSKIQNILLYSGIFLATLGLLQFIFLPDLSFLSKEGWDPHFFRTVSTFLDPNFIGAYFVLTLLLFLQKRALKQRWQIIFFAIIFLALLTTFSRSSYLMFLISGLSISWLKKSIKTALLILILFALLLLSFQIYTQVVAKPRNISREQSASFRLNTWQQGLDIFQKSPLLGTGYNAYRFAIQKYNLADNGFIKSHGSSGNDSSLLFILATTGLTGLVFYLLFLITLARFGLSENIALPSALIGLLVHSLFANSLFYPAILLWIFLKSADTSTEI